MHVFLYTLHLATSEETLDLVSLVSQQVPHIEVEEDVDHSNFTHQISVITGICYGAEVYCVLAHEFDAVETDQGTRQKIEQKFSNLRLNG